jgi:hypothetical protein
MRAFFESVRDDVRIVAEGVDSLSTKVESLRSPGDNR